MRRLIFVMFNECCGTNKRMTGISKNKSGGKLEEMEDGFANCQH